MIAAHRLALATARCTRTSIATPAIRRPTVVCLPVRRIHRSALLRSDEIPRTAQGIPEELKKNQDAEVVESVVEESTIEVKDTPEGVTVETTERIETTTSAPTTTVEDVTSEEIAETSATNAEPAVAEPAVPEAEEVVPWFLRMKKLPTPPKHKQPEPVELKIPEDSPEELEAITTQLADEFGVSELAVVDLRPLDPPPALGVDTIMVVGTARSVKHLHAAADKICRWMRSNYRWSPYADGLLGRNELRLINRRKRRRGKVVSSQMGEVEEAGSSAWVCVHAGKKGIIIQLFTEAKRKEVNVEGLWNGALRRQKRAEAREALAIQELEALEAEPTEVEGEASREQSERNEAGIEEAAEKAQIDRAAEQEKELAKELSAQKASGSSMPSVSSPIAQTRGFHSRSFLCEREVTWVPPLPGSGIEEFVLLKPDNIPNKERFPKPRPMKLTRGKPVIESEDIVYEYTCQEILQHLDLCIPRQTLPAISPGGKAILGDGPHDRDSNPWLRAFFTDIQNYPQDIQQKYEIQFYILANKLNPQKYPGRVLDKYLEAYGDTLRLEHYYLVQKHIASTRPNTPSNNRQQRFPHRLKTLEKQLVQMRENLGDAIVDNYVDSPEYKYLLFTVRVPSHIRELRHIFTTANINSTRRRRLRPEFFPAIQRDHLFTWLAIINPISHAAEGHNTYTIRDHILELLIAYMISDLWAPFWAFWFSLPTYNITRDAAYYKVVLGSVLCFGDNNTILKAARAITSEEMARETPALDLYEDSLLASSYLRVLQRAKAIENTPEFDTRISAAKKIVEIHCWNPERTRAVRELPSRRSYVHKPVAPPLNREDAWIRDGINKISGYADFLPWRRWEAHVKFQREHSEHPTPETRKEAESQALTSVINASFHPKDEHKIPNILNGNVKSIVSLAADLAESQTTVDSLVSALPQRKIIGDGVSLQTISYPRSHFKNRWEKMELYKKTLGYSLDWRDGPARHLDSLAVKAKPTKGKQSFAEFFVAQGKRPIPAPADPLWARKVGQLGGVNEIPGFAGFGQGLKVDEPLHTGIKKIIRTNMWPKAKEVTAIPGFDGFRKIKFYEYVVPGYRPLPLGRIRAQHFPAPRRGRMKKSVYQEFVPKEEPGKSSTPEN